MRRKFTYLFLRFSLQKYFFDQRKNFLDEQRNSLDEWKKVATIIPYFTLFLRSRHDSCIGVFVIQAFVGGIVFTSVVEIESKSKRDDLPQIVSIYA